MILTCEFCNSEFKNKYVLKKHVKSAKYCLKMRGELCNEFKCSDCDKYFNRKHHLTDHYKSCKKRDFNKIILDLQKQLENKDVIIENKDMLLLKYERTIQNLQDKLENIALKAVSRPTSITNNKNIQVNNFLKNAPALTDQVIEDNVKYLTLEHHIQGAEGYAKYALEFPFKGRIVCVDVARNKIKYKDGDGNVIEDVGFQKMMMKLCKALYTKSYDLSIEHLEKLSKEFTEKELEQYDYLEAAKAITMYSRGSESDFCRKGTAVKGFDIQSYTSVRISNKSLTLQRYTFLNCNLKNKLFILK